MKTELQKSVAEEEYKIWRKNVPLLYDLAYTNLLKHSTPSVQWFPDVHRVDNQRTIQRLLMTTFTSGTEPEQLLIGQISFPDTVDEDCIGNVDIDLKVVQSIPLPVDANKCKYCPQGSNIIACKTEAKEILIYDYTKHSSFGSAKGPDLELAGHQQGGFALDWNSLKFGQLVSGGRDALVNVFDINSGLVSSKQYHSDVVNDVCYSRFEPHTFCSVSDDLKIAINDTRTIENTITLERAHQKSVECCSFSPFRAELLATGSADSAVKVWDIRALGNPLYVLRGHSNTLVGCKWSPHYESLLATCSADRRVIIWDLNKTDVLEGEASPEMLFVHGGHTEMVDDIDWNPAEPMELASVSADALFEVWKIPLEKYI